MSDECNRSLTDAERQLARWMLEHGASDAKQYLVQLESAEVTPWRCQCGCASIQFQIQGHAKAPPGAHVLGDFLMGEGDHQSGAFIYSSAGLLSGIEIYGLAGDAPRVLPQPEDLRAFEVTGTENRTLNATSMPRL
jgi:hypothetical protein